MDKLELVFTYERPTKNTVRYREDPSGEDIIVGNIYIRKKALGDPPPQRLRVTIGDAI